jgi:hypothetical protein
MGKSKSHARRLHICPLEIFDGTLGRLSPVGVKSSCSDALLKDITASVIADHVGFKSVDYVRKKYLNDWSRDRNLELQECLITNSHSLIYSDIQKISDMTLAKGLRTLRVALDLSSKGLLHEVLALGRSSLEMLMWAFAIFDLPAEKDPFEFLPERAISGFKIYFPYAGRYYGYLSTFLHWRKETHVRAFDFEEEYMAVVYASGRNKWEAIANVMLMVRLYAEGYIIKYTSLKRKPGGKDCLPKIREVSKRTGIRQREWLKFLSGLEGQRLSKSFVEIFGEQVHPRRRHN